MTVLEKNSIPGGRCGHIIRGGHRFDTGPTLFLMREVFAETFAALGETLEDQLDLRRIDPTYRIRFEDGLELALTSDLSALETQLEGIQPGSFRGILAYLAEGDRHYRLSMQRFVGRNFYSLADYFNRGNLPLLIRVNALSKHCNVFLSGNYQGSFESIFYDHSVPSQPSFYVHAPARVDPAAAPAGHDTLFVLVPVGSLEEARPQDWEALPQAARRAVFQRLAAAGLDDLEQHLKFEIC